MCWNVKRILIIAAISMALTPNWAGAESRFCSEDPIIAKTCSDNRVDDLSSVAGEIWGEITPNETFIDLADDKECRLLVDTQTIKQVARDEFIVEKCAPMRICRAKRHSCDRAYLASMLCGKAGADCFGGSYICLDGENEGEVVGTCSRF